MTSRFCNRSRALQWVSPFFVCGGPTAILRHGCGQTGQNRLMPRKNRILKSRTLWPPTAGRGRARASMPGRCRSAIRRSNRCVSRVGSTIGGRNHFYLEGSGALALPQEAGIWWCNSSTQHPTEIQPTRWPGLGVPMHAVRSQDHGAWKAGFGARESQGERACRRLRCSRVPDRAALQNAL